MMGEYLGSGHKSSTKAQEIERDDGRQALLMEHVPKAIRIREDLKHRILNGELGNPGDKFPTVRALAEDLFISLVTSHRIVTMLREEGYIEHQGRRHVLSSVSAKSKNLATPRLLGLIVVDLENPFFTRLVKSVEAWANKRNLTLMLGNSHYDLETEQNLVNKFVNAGAQGILAAPCPASSTSKNSYEGLHVPTVFLGRKPDGLKNTDVVLAQNYAGGMIVSQHLLSLGERTFWYMGQTVFKDDPRLDGFQDGLNKAGAHLSLKHIMYSPDAAPESAMKTFQKHWKSTGKPAAIFCYHDLLAIGVIRACQAMGLSVPKDVAIVGFDDLPIARDISPSLTTMQYKTDEMASFAVDCMLDKLREKEIESSTHYIKPELIVRQSTDITAIEEDIHPHINKTLAYGVVKKCILILMCFISIQAYSAEWKFNNLGNAEFKDSDGKNLAVFDGIKYTKNLLVDGLYGKAVNFNANYQLKIENSDAISLQNNFTITCVFKPNKISSYRTLLWKGNRNLKPQQINYNLSCTDGKPQFTFKKSDGSWVVTGSEEALIEVGKWYCLTTTMDDKGTITGYLNGVRCFGTNYNKHLVTNNQPLYIGAGEPYYGGGIGYAFNGLIDQVSISSGVTPPTAENIAEFERLAKLADEKADSEKMLKRNTYIETIKASGLIQENLSKMTLSELEGLVKNLEYNKFFITNANGEDMIISVLPTASRILKVDDYSSGKFKLKNKALISAARNEYEGFQLILLGNPQKELKNIKIVPSELKSASGTIISADKIEWGFIHSIKTTKPAYDVDFVGDYPDPIMEGQQETVTVPQNGFAPVYVRVQVDKDVKPGNYDGKIKVGSKDVDVSLTVYDFTLPVTSSCKVIFSFFEDSYKKWYNKDSLSDKDKMYIYDFLLKYRITPNNIYSKDIYPELKFLPELKKKGANFCTLGYLKRAKPVSEEELQQIISNYRQKIDLIREAGLEEDAYLYAFDEVIGHAKAEVDAAKQIMTAIQKELPEIKTIQTSRPDSDLLNCFKVWVPGFSYFVSNEKEVEELNKEGKTFWWYCADSPLKPFPNFFMDYPLLDNRIIFTLSYMYNIDGVLYWAVNREWSTNFDIKREWPEKAWKPYIINVFNKKRQYKNGMGNYIYPGKDGRLLPSLRLENLRDGIEDYEYLMILKKLAGKQEKLLKVPANVATAVNQYSSNPQDLLDYRNQIALMIEKLKKESK